MIKPWEDGFKDGEWYWGYYLDFSNKGNKVKDYTGIFKARAISRRKSDRYDEKLFDYLEWEVEGGKFTTNVSKEILTGGVSSHFIGHASRLFPSYEECAEHHDKFIKAQVLYKEDSLTTKERDKILSYLICSDLPEKESIEIESIKWYESLPEKEQGYVRWIKKHYSGADKC